MQRKVLFNWAPTMCQTRGIHSCRPYHLHPLPTLGLLQLVHMQSGFTVTGSRNHPTMGKWTKGPCQASQAKSRSEESGNPDNNNERCLFNMEQKEVNKQCGIQSSGTCFTKQVSPRVAPFLCVKQDCSLEDQGPFVLPKRSSVWLIFTVWKF